MKATFTSLALIAAFATATVLAVTPAEARKDIYIKKVARKDAVRKSFNVKSYKFSCDKYGDCANFGPKK